LAAGLCAVLLTGCETASQSLSTEGLTFIKAGVTTRSELLAKIGEPTETTVGNGRTLLLYRRFYEASATSTGPFEDSYIRVLSVIIGSDDRVEKFHRYASKLPTSYGAGSASLGVAMVPALVNQIRPNVTRREELLKLLGSPTIEVLNLAGDLQLDWISTHANWIHGVTDAKVLRVWLNEGGVVLGVKMLNDR
jgi:hypothetical protein